MKILVVDDNKKHRQEAAKLPGDVTIVYSYVDALNLLEPGCGFDVVLTDLLMPAEGAVLGTKGLQHLGHEMPIGYAVLLRAGMVGVRNAAIVTDTNHHDHPASAAIDWLCDSFTINRTVARVMHSPMREDPELGVVKDWAEVLRRLVK